MMTRDVTPSLPEPCTTQPLLCFCPDQRAALQGEGSRSSLSPRRKVSPVLVFPKHYDCRIWSSFFWCFVFVFFFKCNFQFFALIGIKLNIICSDLLVMLIYIIYLLFFTCKHYLCTLYFPHSSVVVLSCISMQSHLNPGHLSMCTASENTTAAFSCVIKLCLS